MQFRSAFVGLGLLTLPFIGHTQTSAANSHDPFPALRKGFQDPPMQARLRCYWWWLNGNTDKPTITRDLEEMKAKGYGGALLVDAGGSSNTLKSSVPPGPMFGSPAWVELYTHALKEADRLGLEITLNIMSGWNLGGPTVTPEDASKIITFASLDVSGGHPQEIAIPVPKRKEFYRQIAVLAYPLHHGQSLAPQSDAQQGDHHTKAEQRASLGYPGDLRFRAAAAESGFSMNDSSAMLDDGLSSALGHDSGYVDAAISEVKELSPSADGKVKMDLPAGEWEILSVGYTNSGATVSTSSDTWKGLAIDHMSKHAFDDYWNQNVEPLIAAAKPFHSLKYLATDSWELGGTNWTEGFREQFISRRGYDPVPYLPVLSGRIVENRSVTTKFLTDLRRTVADLISVNHYDHFAERAREHGLGIEAESGGPHGAPIDALETFRNSAVPQTEFWSQNTHRHDDKERFFTKEAASAANIYGKRFVAQEGETSIGPHWSESLSDDLKPSFDMAITEGMNRLVWHEFASSPKSAGIPGQEYFAGTHLNPNVTWWQYSAPFFAYLNRVQFMMQQGVAVNDVLYFYGDHVPNFARLKADDPAHVLPGYDYDVTNEDALLNKIRIEGKELVGPGGVHWRLVALPNTRRVSISVLHFVERYLRAGGTVVSLPPISTTGNMSLNDTKSFEQLVDAIWNGCDGGKHAFQRGTVYCINDTRQALIAMKMIPDVELASGNVRIAPVSADAIDWIHRRVEGRDVYYVRNAYGTSKQFSLRLRASGQAELWDPVTGNTNLIKTQVIDDRALIDLDLPAFGSAIVTFPGHSSAKPFPKFVRKEAADGEWRLSVPGQSVIALKKPRLWNEFPEARYFSGTANYSSELKTPSLKAGEFACLHLSKANEVAEFDIEGAKPSIVWTYPYQRCLRSMQKQRVRVKITVTNLWHNRLVGDAEHGTGKSSSTNILLPIADRALLPSGFTGTPEWWVYSSTNETVRK